MWGVALNINSFLRCKVVDNMTRVVDNIMEIITMEIINEKSKNVLVSCVYRAPGTSVEIFTDIIAERFEQKSTKEVFFVVISTLIWTILVDVIRYMILQVKCIVSDYFR